MKFTKACMLAATSASVANAAGVTTVLDVFSSGMLSETAFFTGLLTNMQRDAGNTNTDCIKGWEDYLELYTDLKTELKSDVEYYAGLKDKGQGNGSAAGFQLQKGAKYIDLLASGVNVYNQCDVDYYMRALSKATSNVSGLAN